ncbi:hypothetical protein L1987_52237 [Smallanthus sonchifolius]|uniref:Uncharacterized protein n=1 Tax=Smallanthus sonchifolius TaxID=185202 RepID=A0ACB9ESV4_9ASTR|nr:hypothetical protein L1987_52237 [Smallanthus sonchifolius]
MVEQMVSSNLSKYGLGKCASIITTATTTTATTTTSEVRDVQNDNKPPRSFEEDQAKGPTPGPTSGNVNRNLVYARRKSDAELSNSDKNRTTSSAYQQQEAGDQKKPDESFAPNPIAATTKIRNFENEQSLSALEHWSARFAQLHNYLHKCDTSNQEAYLQKLRSFSPDECNRHAVELERRAIQLTMQEGTEIKRVKDLNVLLQFGH